VSRDFPVKGLAELDRFLTALPGNLQKQAIRRGLTAAARPIRDEARLRVPKKSGKLARAIRTGSPRQNPDGTFSITVSVTGNDHAFLGYFFEYGVKAHFIRAGDSGYSARILTRRGKSGVDVAARRGKKKGQNQVLAIYGQLVSGAILHPGIRAQPFLVPALDVRAEDAVAAFAGTIRAFIEGKTGFAAPMDEAA
jgi:HK97 gp10 family phage protein